jgi:hypothetical protein
MAILLAFINTIARASGLIEIKAEALVSCLDAFSLREPVSTPRIKSRGQALA